MPQNQSSASSDGGDSALDTEIKSPDYLGHKPKTNKDVIRIGRKPLLIVGAALSMVAGVMSHTLYLKSLAGLHNGDDDSKQNDPSMNIIPLLDRKPREGLIADRPEKIAAEVHKAKETNVVQVPPIAATNSRNPYEDVEFQMWQQRQQEKLQLEAAKRAEFRNALSSETTTYTNNQVTSSQQPLLYGSVKQEQQADYSQPQETTVNIPKEAGNSGSYLLHTRVKPVSQYELKAGSVIPSVMLGGVNSDLPGQIMAQVSQNVYDSATGRHLLIPQGAKLVGSYDHQVAQGHNRVLVVWHRIVYPDSSTVNLENMVGADGSGYSGFKDKTNTHFWTTFRNALMLSAITAGVQLSQPQAQNGSGYSGQQIVAGAMGMQMSNLGMSTISRNLNQPPTIQIRPGYVFNVLITKDIMLPPWQQDVVAMEEKK